MAILARAGEDPVAGTASSMSQVKWRFDRQASEDLAEELGRQHLGHVERGYISRELARCVRGWNHDAASATALARHGQTEWHRDSTATW